MSDLTIVHKPDCAPSRNVLRLIRRADNEPNIVMYLKTTPSTRDIHSPLAGMGKSVRGCSRAVVSLPDRPVQRAI